MASDSMQPNDWPVVYSLFRSMLYWLATEFTKSTTVSPVASPTAPSVDTPLANAGASTNAGCLACSDGVAQMTAPSPWVKVRVVSAPVTLASCINSTRGYDLFLSYFFGMKRL